MKRRDFAKGLAALPFIGAAVSYASICGENSCSVQGPYLLVVLEGQFAVVVQNSKPWNVTAFTPRHDGKHLFAFNRKVCSTDLKYDFRLLQDGLVPATEIPCIYNPYERFCAENTPCLQDRKDHFVSIDLPAPKAIFVFPSFAMAKMEYNDDDVPVPGLHLLVYTVKNEQSIKMFGSDEEELVELPTTKIFDFPVFRFEVGLPNLLGGADSDPDAVHTIDFYNRGLLPHFSEMAADKKKRIRKITAQGHYPAGIMPRLQGIDFDKFFPILMATTTFECKIGGNTVTSP